MHGRNEVKRNFTEISKYYVNHVISMYQNYQQFYVQQYQHKIKKTTLN